MELRLARDVSYEVDDTGGVKERPANICLLPNIRLAFRLYLKHHDSAFALDVSHAGWSALRRATKVRHRLVHPKHTTDLSDSDEEVSDALSAFEWLNDQIEATLLTAAETLEAEAVHLRNRCSEENLV